MQRELRKLLRRGPGVEPDNSPGGAIVSCCSQDLLVDTVQKTTFYLPKCLHCVLQFQCNARQ